MIDRVLFVTEKYCDADPKCGPTNAESMLIGAIKSTDLIGDSKHFYFEVLCQQLGKGRMAELLLEDCQVFQPDLVIYTPIGGLLGVQLNPSNEVLNEMRNRGIKLFTYVWDATGREQEVKLRYVPFSDYTGILDSIVTPAQFDGDPRIIQVYSAIDPRDFYDRNLGRDIDVCFVGGVGDPQRWPQRAQYINFLRSNGVNIVVAGGQRNNRLSWQEYAGFLNRSKISLNWSKNLHVNTCQLKGRVFETMACGAMLMEDNGDQTRRLFETGKDFVVFESPEDLLKQVRYYLVHDEEREAIAKSGCEKVTKIYNARNIWGYVFEKMGFKLPDDLVADKNFKKHEEIMESLKC